MWQDLVLKNNFNNKHRTDRRRLRTIFAQIENSRQLDSFIKAFQLERIVLAHGTSILLIDQQRVNRTYITIVASVIQEYFAKEKGSVNRRRISVCRLTRQFSSEFSY